MVGSGFISEKKSSRSFDIGADVQIGNFSFSGGVNISKEGASLYTAGGYVSEKLSKSMGYLKISKLIKIKYQYYKVKNRDFYGGYENFLKEDNAWKRVGYI